MGFFGSSAVKKKQKKNKKKTKKNNLPAEWETQETHVQSLGWEDPLEEGMASHSSILSWRIPCTEKLGGL